MKITIFTTIFVLLIAVFGYLTISYQLNTKSDVEIIKEVIYDNDEGAWYILTDNWAIEFHEGKYDEYQYKLNNIALQGKQIKINYTDYENITGFRIIKES